MGEEWKADAVVFIGAVVNDAILVDVKDGAEHEFGLVEGIGKVGNIGKVAVRHTDDVIDAQGRLVGSFGVTAVIKVFFVGIEVVSRSVGMKAGLVRSGVEIAAKEGVIGRSEAETLGGGDGFGKKNALEQGGDVGEREVVGSGKIVGFGNYTMADLVGAAFEDAADRTGVGHGIELGGLLMDGIALGGMEADGVGVAVGGGIAGGEAAGDANVGVAELGETLVEGALAEEFVEAVISHIIANQEHPLDVVADGGSLVGIGGSGKGDGGLTITGGASDHDSAAIYPYFVEVVKLFEGEGDNRKLDQAGGVEVLLRIEMIGIGGKKWAVLSVAVDLGVNDLELVLEISGDAG